jgi:hypothetical protein
VAQRNPAPSEPRVVTEDVASRLERHVASPDEDGGDSVQLIAEKAKTSTRTVYRILSRTQATLSLDLADRLLVAVDEHYDLLTGEIRVIEDGS